LSWPEAVVAKYISSTKYSQVLTCSCEGLSVYLHWKFSPVRAKLNLYCFVTSGGFCKSSVTLSGLYLDLVS
jgi:hypothetical protein